MKDKTIVFSLLTCAVGALLFILAVYLWFGGNPYHRLGYGLTMSIIPALLTLLLTRRNRHSWTWTKTAGTYIVLFSLAVIIQAFARKL